MSSSATIRVVVLCGLLLPRLGLAEVPIDLPTALRLAGAQNLEVQIASQRLSEARARRLSAVLRFLPWLAPGLQYHRHDGRAQAVPAGTVAEGHFQSLAPGITVTVQLALGEAIYGYLAARQTSHASRRALEARRQDATLSAALAYFDLARARALVQVARESLRIAEDYRRELHQAVAAGIAFRGDELRVQAQSERYQIALRRAATEQRVAAASLAQVLRLDPALELVPQEGGLVPLALVDAGARLDELLRRALTQRPELAQSEALVAAARARKIGALYGPLIPRLSAQVFGGGFGGGPDGAAGTFGAAGDYAVGLSWRIGPGGLLDFGRVGASRARLAAAQLRRLKLRDRIATEVVTVLSRVQSLSDEIELARRNLTTASEALRLTRQRKQYGVGAVLEDLQAQQALNQARSDYFVTVAELNKAQYALHRAVGEPPNRPVQAAVSH
jgi:outer membrane protein TolC